MVLAIVVILLGLIVLALAVSLSVIILRPPDGLIRELKGNKNISVETIKEITSIDLSNGAVIQLNNTSEAILQAIQSNTRILEEFTTNHRNGKYIEAARNLNSKISRITNEKIEKSNLLVYSATLASKTNIKEAKQYLKQALTENPKNIEALTLTAWANYTESKFEQAHVYITSAVDVSREFGTDDELAYCLYGVSRIAINLGNYEEAEKAAIEAININKKSMNFLNLSFGQLLLSDIYYSNLKYQDGLDSLEKAIDYSSEITNKDKQRLVQFRIQTGKVLCLMGIGEIGEAQAIAQDVLKDSTRFSDPHMNAVILSSLGNIMSVRGELETSIDYIEQAILEFEKTDSNAEVAAQEIILANLYLRQPDTMSIENINALICSSKNTFQRSNNIGKLAEIALLEANLLKRNGASYTELKDKLEEALKLGSKYPNTKCRTLIQYFCIETDPDKSEYYLYQAKSIADKYQLVACADTIYYMISNIVFGQGDYKLAIPLFEELILIEKTTNNITDLAESHFKLARCFQKTKDIPSAKIHFLRSKRLYSDFDMNRADEIDSILRTEF